MTPSLLGIPLDVQRMIISMTPLYPLYRTCKAMQLAVTFFIKDNALEEDIACYSVREGIVSFLKIVYSINETALYLTVRRLLLCDLLSQSHKVRVAAERGNLLVLQWLYYPKEPLSFIEDRTGASFDTSDILFASKVFVMLNCSIRNSRVNVLKWLIEEYSLDLSSWDAHCDSLGRTSVETLDILLQRGYKVSNWDVFSAAEVGNIDLVSKLLTLLDEATLREFLTSKPSEAMLSKSSLPILLFLHERTNTNGYLQWKPYLPWAQAFDSTQSLQRFKRTKGKGMCV